MSEIKTDVAKFMAVDGPHDGEVYAVIGPQHTLADIARWISRNPGDAQEMILLLQGELELPNNMRDETALEIIRDYQTALEGIAEPVYVPLRKPKKMYKKWRKIATSRIDIARKALGMMGV